MSGLLQRTLGESIKVTTKTPADLWMTTIDPHQLENALLNLAVNSLHAMPDGGSLIIEASNRVLDEISVAQHPNVPPGHYVRIAVSDTGFGISADILERVLEPFFTTKPVGKGSGLGLSMVKGFVEQSGGYLNIYSDAGHGATVKLYLPKAFSVAEHESDVREGEIRGSPGGELVMVVEDNPEIRSLTLRILTGPGYRTVAAEDGQAACALLESVDHIDLLLTDVVLPKGMTGPEVARQVRALRPAIKVLYMSGYPRDAVFRDGGSENEVHLLSKPFSKAELAQMVRKVIDEGNG